MNVKIVYWRYIYVFVGWYQGRWIGLGCSADILAGWLGGRQDAILFGRSVSRSTIIQDCTVDTLYASPTGVCQCRAGLNFGISHKKSVEPVNPAKLCR